MHVQRVTWEAASTAVESGRVELSRKLTIAIAIQDDHVVQAVLRRAAGLRPQQPFALKVLANELWRAFGPGASRELRRSRPVDIPTFVLEDLVRADPRLNVSIDHAIQATAARRQANELTQLLYGANPLSRGGYEALLVWAPLIETSAYNAAVRVSMAMDGLRKRLLQVPRREQLAVDLAAHADLALMLARLSILACNPDARSWLPIMAQGFDWAEVSPSWLLTRERSLGLSLSAARCAAAFGPDVIAPYFRRLIGARRPMVAYDAVFGLTAIALSDPASLSAIKSEYYRLMRHTPWLSPDVAIMIPQLLSVAIKVLEQPDAAAKEWTEHPRRRRTSLDARQGLLHAEAEFDPVIEAASFLALASATTVSPAAYFPARASWVRPIPIRTLGAMFNRAWGPGGVQTVRL